MVFVAEYPGACYSGCDFGLRVSSGQMEICGADTCTPWSSWSSPNSRVSSVGVREAMGSYPTDSIKEVSQVSCSSSCMRGARHLCRSQTVPHIVLGGVPGHSAQHCRALASTTVCSLLTSQMSLVPWNLHSGKKSHHPRPLSQGGAFHEPTLSSWAAGNLKPAACFFLAPVSEHY